MTGAQRHNRPATSAPPPELAALIDDFFRCVSFAAGEQPRYDGLRALFIAEGRLIKNSLDSPDIADVDQFIATRRALIDAGALTSFGEVERSEITEWFGNIAHRLTVYDKRGTMNGHAFEGRGVISTQFIRTPAGWRISVMAWDDERPGLALADHYAVGDADPP